MNLDFEIEKGGQSDQLAKGLKDSTQAYSEDMLMSAGMGAANVINSTGINVGRGSTDEIIADNIAATISLTGEQGLTNLANGLENYTQQLTAMGLNAPEELVEIILQEITKVLQENGVIDGIKTGMQITQNTIEFAKAGMQYATSIATTIANIQKLLTQLDKTGDVDVTCIPSVKDSLSVFTASLINQLKSQYEALKQQLILFYNSMICTSNDAVLDNIVVSVNNILEVLEPALDPASQKYTGFTIAEIQNICNQGFAYIGMMQRAAKKRKDKKEQEKQEEAQIESDDDISKYDDPKIAKKLSKEEKEKLKQKRRERSKKKWEEKKKDLSPEKAKEKLLDWLSEQNIMIQNAFHILIIKQTIEDIKTYIEQLQNTSIENQVDLLNMLNETFVIFEELGLTPDAKGITMDDLKLLGMAVAGTAVETTVNIGNQVKANSNQFTQEMIDASNTEFVAQGGMVLSNNVIQDARGTVAGITATSYGVAGQLQNQMPSNGNVGQTPSASDIAKHTASVIGVTTISAGVDQTINNIIDAGLNTDMEAIANGNIQTINTKSFNYEQTNEDKNIYINVTINKNPSLHLLDISSFISSFRSGSGKEIFNNGQKKRIKNGFKDAWEINETAEVKIQAIVDGITKFYTFTFNVNQDARKNPSKYESQDESEDSSLSDASNKTKSAGKNAKDKGQSIANNANGQTSGFVNNANDKAKNMKNGAISQLTKVNVNINADQIEAVLAGKVLMFDEVVQFLKVLQPIIQTLKVVAHLLENYVINKEFIRTGQHANLAYALKNAAQLVNGLKDIFQLNDTNFFTVRTKETANWIMNTFNQKPDEFGFLVIGQIDTIVDGLSITTGNNADTVKLNNYCATHYIVPDYPLNLFKGTTIYFDSWSIEKGGYKDGTTSGIDNIEINRELGEIYFDKLHRSTISSEILRAKKRSIEPNYVRVLESAKNKKNDIKSLLDAVTFSSDEFEGTQTLDMCNLDLCSPNVKNKNKARKKLEELKEKKKDSALIIEFGDEYTLGNKVEYTLTVKPGQAITPGTILGYVKKDGKQLPIRTQYTGVVRSTDDSNTDFYHLYPTAATRHIVIDNPVKCSASDYNINDVMSLQQKFKKATELEALIINCMPLSILPSLLVNANRTSDMSQSYTTYDNIIKQYDHEIYQFAKNLEKSSKNFKEKTQTGKSGNGKLTANGKSTTISLDAAQKVKDDMLNERKKMVKSAIETFTKAIDKKQTKVNGDINYLDCVGLGYSDSIIFKRVNDDGDKLEYNNYYLNLLKSIPESPKQSATININVSDIQAEIDKMHLSDASIAAGEHINMNNESLKFDVNNVISNLNSVKLDEDDSDNRLKEFKRLIEQIIDIRLSYEKQTNMSMISIFNNYYYNHIKKIRNAFDDLNDRLEKGNIDKQDSQSILDQIKKDKGYEGDFDSDKNEVCKQALTLFMYLINADIKGTSDKIKSVYNIEKTYTQPDVKSTIIEVAEIYINKNKTIQYNNKTYSGFEQLYKDVKTDEIKKLQQAGPMVSDALLDENIINQIKTLLNTKTPGISGQVVEQLINAYKVGLDTKKISNNTILYFENIAENNRFYQMTKDEAKSIEAFWKKVIDEYNTTCNIDNAINDITNYANKLNENIDWPQSIGIQIDSVNYELYTFTDPFKTPNELPNDIEMEECDIETLQDNLSIPVTVDLEDIKDLRENDPITIFDYEYWLVYMLNATLFTLIPSFWADGFDIPPFMVPLLLPAIYLPIAPPVMIPMVNVLMVFGIALRGMWPAPIILMVNLSSDDIDVMIFLKIALETIKDIFKKMQELTEKTIPMIVNEMILGYLDENEAAQKAIEKFRIYSSIIKAIPIENKALIEKHFNDALQDEMNKSNKMNQASVKMIKQANDIKKSERGIIADVNDQITDAQKKMMQYDRRQVITRESDLGNGPAPF